MTEIEKMFENAGINKRCCANIKFDDCIYSPSDCGYYNYPDFTAEKQLAIFKIFCRRYLEVSQHVEENGDLCFGIKATVGDYAVGFNKDFVECLADFVNCLYQDLTDQEKEEIRNILNE